MRAGRTMSGLVAARVRACLVSLLFYSGLSYYGLFARYYIIIMTLHLGSQSPSVVAFDDGVEHARMEKVLTYFNKSRHN